MQNIEFVINDTLRLTLHRRSIRHSIAAMPTNNAQPVAVVYIVHSGCNVRIKQNRNVQLTDIADTKWIMWISVYILSLIYSLHRSPHKHNALAFQCHCILLSRQLFFVCAMCMCATENRFECSLLKLKQLRVKHEIISDWRFEFVRNKSEET